MGYAAKSVYDLIKLRHANASILPGTSALDDIVTVGNIDYSDVSALGKVDDVVESGVNSNYSSKFDYLLNSDYYKYDPGYDCSEIAEDFYEAADCQGIIYRIEGKKGNIKRI